MERRDRMAESAAATVEKKTTKAQIFSMERAEVCIAVERMTLIRSVF